MRNAGYRWICGLPEDRNGVRDIETGSVPSESIGIQSLPAQGFAYGFSRRKRSILRQFLGGMNVVFVDRAWQVPRECTLLLWGSSPLPDRLAGGVRIVRVEDGFVRSVGLGADLVHPLSWVFDGRGIYYDATRPSDLEHLLQTYQFTDDLRDRAASLQRYIVAHALTKYNVGARHWERPPNARRVVLVPGQVETDASIRFGTRKIRTNMELLETVRHTERDAHVVYKPHPDVAAGLRAKGVKEEEAPRWCDEVVTDVPMGEMLAKVDELHVLTSLAGFEALLRGKTVVCHGMPFYAGWGLTRDVEPMERRGRRLTVEEMVAAALILYPAYVSRVTGRRITPEQALDELLEWYGEDGGGVPLWRRFFRVVLRRVVGVH